MKACLLFAYLCYHCCKVTSLVCRAVSFAKQVLKSGAYAIQDMVFGFKSTSLFHVRNVEDYSAAARQVEAHMYAGLLRRSGGFQVQLNEELCLRNTAGTLGVLVPS